MIQELLGSGGSAPNTGVIGERNISISFPSPSPSPACPPPTTPIFTASSVASPATTKGVNSSNSSGGGNGANNSETTTQQNLRCPRCDSTNTKFCYYNNYNLTQPRHFCKTCRRYWTKGGTLRNVPIGGGCRKNKTTIGSGSSATSGISMPSKSSSNAMAKAKATLSTEMLLNASPGFLGPRLLDHLHPLPHPELQPGSDLTQALWPSVPQEQSSHILAVIRGATQFTNPNPNPSLSQVSSVFTHLKSESNTTLGLDPCGSGAPSIFGSFLRGNPHQINGFGLGAPNDVQNGGSNSSTILELYQRLKSSSNYSYCSNENPGSMVLGNVMGSSSSLPSPLAMNSSILENASGAVGENLGGYSMMTSPGISSWSDFPTVPINGALP